MRRRYLKRREGFTLIELLVVLAIIGALMAIGIPIYTNATVKAKALSIASNIQTIAHGVVTRMVLEGKTTPPSNNAADYINVTNPGSYTITDIGDSIEVSYRDTGSDQSFFQNVADQLKGCSEAGATPSNYEVYCRIKKSQ